MHAEHYLYLAIMTFLMFIAMYALIYAMVDRLEKIYSNLNQVYMAGLMTEPIVLIELAVVRGTYGNRRPNVAIVGIATQRRNAG